jgi:hypothetical protein
MTSHRVQTVDAKRKTEASREWQLETGDIDAAQALAPTSTMISLAVSTDHSNYSYPSATAPMSVENTSCASEAEQLPRVTALVNASPAATNAAHANARVSSRTLE